MKINQEELKKLYLSLAKKQTVKQGDCPDVKNLMEAFTGEVSTGVKTKIVDHISRCGLCLDKFQTIREFFNQGKKLASEMEDLSISKEDLLRLKYNQSIEIQPPKKIQPIKRFLAAAAILLVTVGLVLILLTGTDTRDTLVRGNVGGDFFLESPRGAVNRTMVVFKWQSMPGATGYRVDLFDEELTRIWKSPITGKTLIKLPDDITQNLVQDNMYYWQLVLFQANTITRKSVLQKFIIK